MIVVEVVHHAKFLRHFWTQKGSIFGPPRFTRLYLYRYDHTQTLVDQTGFHVMVGVGL